MKGDNLAAVTALNVVENGHFRQIAEIRQMQSVEQTNPRQALRPNRFPPLCQAIFTGPRNNYLRSPFRPQNLSRRRR